MAAFSISIARASGDSLLGQSGTANVTFGTLAPNANDVEIRISSAAIGSNGGGITLREVEELADILWRSIVDSYVINGNTAVWPNL